MRFAIAWCGMLAAALWAPSPARAHDFWLEPDRYHLATPGEVAVELKVGEAFRGEVVSRRASHLRRFELIGPAGRRDVPGAEGLSPAGSASVAAPGVYWLAYTSAPQRLTLSAGKFARYLSEVGLEHALELDASGNKSPSAIREIYSRNAKSLLVVGDRSTAKSQPAPLGLPLELVPVGNLAAATAPAKIELQLLFRSAPVAGALVKATPASGPRQTLQARSDARGRVALTLETTGPWLVTAVHMTEAPADAGADWESWWASLTFLLPSQ